MKTNEIKKGMKILSNQLGVPVSGIMMDNLKGNTRLIKTNGKEVGLFIEIGSVYAYNNTEVQDEDGFWHTVEHTPAQLKLKEQVGRLSL